MAEPLPGGIAEESGQVRATAMESGWRTPRDREGEWGAREREREKARGERQESSAEQPVDPMNNEVA